MPTIAASAALLISNVQKRGHGLLTACLLSIRVLRWARASRRKRGRTCTQHELPTYSVCGQALTVQFAIRAVNRWESTGGCPFFRATPQTSYSSVPCFADPPRHAFGVPRRASRGPDTSLNRLRLPRPGRQDGPERGRDAKGRRAIRVPADLLRPRRAVDVARAIDRIVRVIDDPVLG